jgi:hypothetical protein
MPDLLSTAPWVFEGFLSLVQATGAAQSPPVAVVPFMLEEYEPASYVMLTGIEGHRFEWETIGSFSQKEYYSLTGVATVFVGDSPDSLNPAVATNVLNETYALFNNVIMTTVMSNRIVPVLNNAYPIPGAVYSILPGYARYTASPGVLSGIAAGWEGTIQFAYDIMAYITPA